MFFRRLIFVACMALPFFFLSCSFADPSISTVNQYIVFEQQRDMTVSPMLSIFFTWDDGGGDFSRMEISCNKTGYMWVVDESKVQINEYNGETWIGYSRLLPPAGQLISDGLYTLTVYNRAEKIDIYEFEITTDDLAFDFSDYKFPISCTVQYDKNAWEVTTDFAKRQFVFFDSAMQPSGVFVVNAKHGRLDVLQNKAGQAESARFYAYKDGARTVYSLPAFTFTEKRTMW